HTDHYAAVCARGIAARRGDEQVQWLRMVTQESDNIRSALTRLVERECDTPTAATVLGALGWFWWLAGRATEGSRLIQRIAERVRDTPAVVRARLLAWGGYLGGSELADHDVDRIVNAALDGYYQAGALEEFAEMASILAVMYSTRGNQPRMR